jgi:hypothetical protein
MNDFYKIANEFKDWNKKFLTDEIITPAVDTAVGSNRIGTAVFPRFIPSANFVSESYHEAISFFIDNPLIDDLMEDDDLVELHNLLQDYIAFMDRNLNEGSLYTGRTDRITKIKNRKRYKRDRAKILARIKRQKKTIKGITLKKKQDRMSKTNQRTDGKQKRKYHTKKHLN